MKISEYTIDDFIYDPSFRKWVLQPDVDSKKYWDDILLEYPFQCKNVMKAREILLRMMSEEDELSEVEVDQIWAHIDSETGGLHYKENKVIPLHSFVNLESPKRNKPEYWQGTQFFRVAAILIVSFGLGVLATTFFNTPDLPVQPDPIVFEEHHTLRGVKSYLTLSDGSNVILNSGSSIKYVKGFDKDKREIYLDGEAYFDVYKDAVRPFIVRNADISITALGTSFNVEAYGTDDLNISLISGKVGIDLDNERQQYVLLEKGESLQVKPIEGTWTKALFNEDEVLGWTRKIIIFNKIPVSEAVRVLENWYGISFQLENKPSPGLLLSGTFEDETLENVLKGLSYTTHLEYKIKNDIVSIRF